MNNEHCADETRPAAANTADATGDLILKNQQFSSSHTSNDLWSGLNAEFPPKTMHYEIVAQNTAEVENLENAPAVSMAAYLVESDQMHLLRAISIYSERGTSPDQIRLLYMNASALLIWKAMGRIPTLVGARHRPPATALLMYGVPFSE